MEERTKIMQWFADWCTGTKDVNNVAELKRGAA
jgi:hypothetical protein